MRIYISSYLTGRSDPPAPSSDLGPLKLSYYYRVAPHRMTFPAKHGIHRNEPKCRYWKWAYVYLGGASGQ